MASEFHPPPITMSTEIQPPNAISISMTELLHHQTPSASKAPSTHEYQETSSQESSLPPKDLLSTYPEGGQKAWLTVAGAAACLFVSFGWVNCAGIFQDYYQANQLSSYSPSEIAWIPALQIFFMIFAGVLVGKVFDDYGPAVLLATGTFLHVLGLMMASISDRYYQIMLSQAVCSGIGASMVFFPAFNCVSG